MMEFPMPEITALSAPYWEALKAGKLLYQACRACGNHWLPARDACPRCLAPEPVWEEASGRATLVSWVMYHTAYHDAFKSRLPYVVACVELEEGPRMLTNLVGPGWDGPLSLDAALLLRIEREGELALARFRLVSAMDQGR
jgi:uncharacterized OB-fold protein